MMWSQVGWMTLAWFLASLGQRAVAPVKVASWRFWVWWVFTALAFEIFSTKVHY